MSSFPLCGSIRIASPSVAGPLHRDLDAVHKDEKWTMEKHQEEEHDPLAALPAVPAKTAYEPPGEQTYNADSRLPGVESAKVSAMTNASERERLQTSMKAASTTLQLCCQGVLTG